MIDRPLCIYHRNCLDGMTAGWVIKTYYPCADMLDADYGEKPPRLEEDQAVYIVDFSYSGEQLVEMCRIAKHVTVIDHHEKAIMALTSYFAEHQCPSNLTLILNQEHSGAALTWSFFHDGVSPPTIVDLVEDRDLWHFKHPTTRAYCQALMSLPMTMESWTWAAGQSTAKMVERGEILLAMLEEQICWILENSVRMVQWGEHLVPLINVPKFMVSEVNNRLINMHDFVIGYYDGPEHRVFRFNCSKSSPLNMSLMASEYGGGGHRTSAGLKVPRSHWLASI